MTDSSQGRTTGSAHLALAADVVPLHPEEAVFVAILDGWAVQQRSCRLAAGTSKSRDQRATR